MDLAIVHFQPIEFYPPLQNLVKSLKFEEINFRVYTTKHKRCYNTINVDYISFFSSYAGTFFQRYICFFYFNLGVFLSLFFNRPKKLFCFETYSVLPCYFYLFLFPDTRLFVHFHEFDSVEQKLSASNYHKFLQFIEKKLLKKAYWISHTNIDRKALFITDNPMINQDRIFILPNYPLKSMWSDRLVFQSYNSRIRLVYIGALGIETTYISELLRWLFVVRYTFELTLITGSVEDEVFDLINNYKGSNFYLKSRIPYNELPQVLPSYDVGLVLYNGHIPNMKYNIPNKVNEYLAAGLNVWYSSDLISTINFSDANCDYPMIAVDFKALAKGIVDAPVLRPFSSGYSHWHEDSIVDLMKELLRKS